MAEISEVVAVTVNVADKVTQGVSFGTPLVIGTDTIKTGGSALAVNTTRTYTSVSGVATDWETSTQTYKDLVGILSQSPRVASVKVARRTSPDVAQVQTVTFSADFVASNSIAFLIEGTTTTVVWNTSNAQTYTDIAAALLARADISACTVDAVTHVVTITTDPSVVDGGLTITSAVVTGGVSQPTATIAQTVAAVNLLTALAAIQIADPDWFCLDITDRDSANIQRAAGWLTGYNKIGVFQSNDSGVVDAGSTTDVAYILEASSNNQAALVYHPIDGDALAASLIGRKLPVDPDRGSTTWCYANLQGVSPGTVLAAESLAALAKNCNTYETIGGDGRLRDGKMASGRFIDVQITIFWVQARIQEAIWDELKAASDRNSKIPFTDAGIEVIRKAVDKVLQQGQRVGHFLDGIENRSVVVPLVADVSTSDKSARHLEGVEASVTLAGAIHTLAITVNASL